MPARLSRQVWERTGGNPYWLCELLVTASGHEVITAEIPKAVGEVEALVGA